MKSQNWAPFTSVSKKFFSEAEAPIGSYSIKFDTTYVDQGDTIFDNMKVKVSKGAVDFDGCFFWGSCQDTISTSWLGRIIRQESKDLYLFINDNDDTLSFDFSEDGLKRTVYSNSNEKLELEYKRTDYEGFLGYQDSIRVFELSHKDQNNAVIQDGYDGFEIELGKRLGLLSFININDFPIKYQGYKLLGAKNPDIGIHKISFLDVYDFNVGHKFTIHKYTKINQAPPEEAYDSTLTFTVLNKDTLTPGQISYLFDVKGEGVEYEVIKVYLDDIIDQIPFEEKRLLEYSNGTNNLEEGIEFDLSFTSKCNSNYLKLTYDNTLRSSTYCAEKGVWCSIDTDGPVGTNNLEYYVGLGAVIDDLSPPVGSDWSTHTGSEITGFSDVDGWCGPVSVYPIQLGELRIIQNLSSSVINLMDEEFGMKASYKIFNAVGQVIEDGLLNENGVSIDITKLNQGHYFLLIKDQGEMKMGRFIKVK